MTTDVSVSGAPTQVFVQSVLSGVAEELADVARAVEDGGLTERLEKAAALISWLRAEMVMDRSALAIAEADLRSVVGAQDESSNDARYGAIQNVLAIKVGQPTGHHRREESGPTDQVSGRTTPTVDQVSAYLDARNTGDHAHSVRTIVGGFSKVTLLVDATLQGVRQDLVFRQIPAGRKASSLGPEFDVVSFVHGRGLPAPRPLWLEASENALGGAFFAMTRAPGENIGDVWGQRGASRELCLEIADIYARLHKLPVDGLNAPVSPRRTPEELRAMIDWQVDVLDKRGISVEPIAQALLDWLYANIPTQTARKSLIHGDAAFSNFLVDHGHVAAVLDWEAAHVGDAADELAYLRPSVEPVMPWPEFLAQYVAAGGVEPPEASMRFFTVWSYVWRYLGCLWLSQNFNQTGRYPSAVAAYVHGPKFLTGAVDAAFS